MNNDFSKRLKEIEAELLRLKTASEYSSIRSVSLTHPVSVTTGLYRVTYEQTNEPIIAMFYKNDDNYCLISGRTPNGNSQVLEVLATYWDNASQTYITDTSSLIVVSNVPVVDITRIS